jgi:hypothetical protein
VWIVQHDGSPDNTVLRVFTTRNEADVFINEVRNAFGSGVILGACPVGFRDTGGAARHSDS